MSELSYGTALTDGAGPGIGAAFARFARALVALDPGAIAQTSLSVLAPPRSAWPWEVELRPWAEKF